MQIRAIQCKKDKTNKDNIGVILLNLGGPDSLQAVRPFLYNLFSDRHIIKLGHPFMQKPLAWLIAEMRSKKTERFYSLIGGKSPIRDITMAQAKALEEALNENAGNGFKVYVGMRYWYPLIEDVIPLMFKDGIRKIIALSLYPQYSVVTTGSSLSKLKEILIKTYQPKRNEISKINDSFSLQKIKAESSFTVYCSAFTVCCITSWFNHPLYIESLVDVIKKGLESFSILPEVLFSAHNIPQKTVADKDPYVNHTVGTIEEITKRIPIKWHLSYQSKSGPVKWLEPSTDKKLEELARAGAKNILIVPISFVSDNVETLYEIDILCKGIAEKNGIKLKRTESLNIHPTFIKALKEIVKESVANLG